MPQSNILEPSLRVGTHHAGQPADLLAGHRIAFVGHRGRALLLFAKKLFHLSNFGALQMPDLRSDLIQRAGNHRERSQIRSMTVALNHLGRDCRSIQSQASADFFFELGAEMGEGAHGAGKFTNPHIFRGALEASDITLHLRVPVR